MTTWGRAAEFLGFQVVWIICAIGAARGSSLPAVLAALTFVAAQVVLGRRASALLAVSLASAALGALVESLFAATALIAYAAPWPATHLAPLWIVALWFAFGATLPATRQLLGDRPFVKAAGLGAIFGPLSYVAGESLGAVALGTPRSAVLAALCVAWAGLYPAVLALAGRLDPPR